MTEQLILKQQPIEKGRDKYLKELQSNSVCSDESEAVSANSKTPVPKFLYEDCLAQIKSNQKNIHITKHFFSNGSFKIDTLVKKTVYLYLINSKFTSNIYIESCIFDCSYSKNFCLVFVLINTICYLGLLIVCLRYWSEFCTEIIQILDE